MKTKWISAMVCMAISAIYLSGCAAAPQEAAGNEQPTEWPSGEAYTQLDKEDYVLCASSDKLELYFQPSTTHFLVKNLQDNSQWYSSPQILEEETASRLEQMKMQASLLIDYTDIGTNKVSTTNTYTGSVQDGDYTIELLQDGVCFRYHVSEIGATIPFYVRLDGDSLVTDVDTASIESQQEDIRITSIAITPYFISGRGSDEGYLFLPDGSGALVRFGTANVSADTYSRPIYGDEPTNLTMDYYLRSDEENICLPVWGMVSNGSALMAIGEEGVECGTLNAAANGQLSSMANAYISYSLLNSVMYYVGSQETRIYDDPQYTLGRITTRYLFLAGEDANYSGMARRYRAYLQETYELSDGQQNKGLYLDVYAGVTKTISTLGIPHETVVPLTTTEQLLEITDYLQENGAADITVRYRLWNSDELYGKRITSAEAASQVVKGSSLEELTARTDIRVFPALMSLQTYRGGGFIDHVLNASQSITGLPFTWYEYSPSTLQETSDAFYRNSLEKFPRMFEKLLDSLQSDKIQRLALGDIGSQLYCDYTGEGYRRTESKEQMAALVKKASEGTESLMLDAANAYACIYADVIYSAPICHSGQDILDESVPFYSLALNGLAECVAPPLNSSNVGDHALLYTVASGSGLCYSLIYEDASMLLDTPLSGLSGASFETFGQEAADRYNQLAEVYALVGDSRMYSHEYVGDGLSVTTYENGVNIYVNFGQSAAVLPDGTELAAESFAARMG